MKKTAPYKRSKSKRDLTTTTTTGPELTKREQAFMRYWRKEVAKEPVKKNPILCRACIAPVVNFGPAMACLKCRDARAVLPAHFVCTEGSESYREYVKASGPQLN